jgi:hypothetical protein
MTVRRVLAAAALTVGIGVFVAPTASARSAACAWVDPHGVCVSNPLDELPRAPIPPLP